MYINHSTSISVFKINKNAHSYTEEPEKSLENKVEKETEVVENGQTDKKESEEKSETVENGENAEKVTEEKTEAEQKPENKPTETEEKAEGWFLTFTVKISYRFYFWNCLSLKLSKPHQ